MLHINLKSTSHTLSLLSAITLSVFGITSYASAQAPLWLGDWYPALQLKLVADDNINRALDGEGEKSEFIIRPSLRAERQEQLAPATFSHSAVTLEGAIHGKYSGLNYVAPGVEFGVRQQVGEGVDGLSLRASMGLAYEFHNQDIRFGAVADPRLEARVGIHQQIDLGIFYAYDHRFVSEKSIYDVSGHTLGANAIVAMTEEASLVLGYQYRRGDVIVHEQNAPGDLGAEVRGSRLPLDTFKDRFTAVQLEDVDTHTIDIGLRYGYSIFTTIHVGYRFEEIKDGSDSYPSNQFFLSVLHLL